MRRRGSPRRLAAGEDRSCLAAAAARGKNKLFEDGHPDRLFAGRGERRPVGRMADRREKAFLPLRGPLRHCCRRRRSHLGGRSWPAGRALLRSGSQGSEVLRRRRGRTARQAGRCCLGRAAPISLSLRLGAQGGVRSRRRGEPSGHPHASWRLRSPGGSGA